MEAFKLIMIALLGTGLAACSSFPKQGSQRKYQTKYSHTSGKINTFDVKDYTSAPLRIVVMARVNVSTKKAFDLVARDIPVWFKDIPSISWDHKMSKNINNYGVGSIRKCELDGESLYETISLWEEGKIYAYQADMNKSTVSMPIKDHLGMFIIESDGNGGSLITWRQYYNKKFHIMAPMLTWYMRTQMMESAFENLTEKFGGELVEPVSY